MRTRNKHALIFFCLLLSAAAVLSGEKIHSELKERQKEKKDFASVAEIAKLPMTEAPAESVTDTETETSAEPTEQSATEHNIPALIAVNGDCIGWLSMLDMTEIDKAVLRSKMTECLARKYKELGNGCCAVQRLKAELGSTADIAERLNRAVSEIRLYTDKTADIILLNGQIIRKESDNGTDCCIPAESGADNRTDRIGQRNRENPLPSPAGGGILPRFH